jgi:Kef-type K+ transport system membrane component KefB
MGFFVWLIEAIAVCFQGEKDWHIGRILFIIAVVVAIALLGYWLGR